MPASLSIQISWRSSGISAYLLKLRGNTDFQWTVVMFDTQLVKVASILYFDGTSAISYEQHKGTSAITT